MTEVATDERGRITIPKDVRERLGERYRMVELRDGLKLLPIPKDPVASLKDAASAELREATLESLRAAALEEAREQTGGHVR